MDATQMIEALAAEFEEIRRMTKKRKFEPEQKHKAVDLLKTGIHPEDLAARLGVSRSTIDVWAKNFSEVEVSDFVPLQASNQQMPVYDPNLVEIRVMSVSVSVPISEIPQNLAHILSGHGGER